jgi:hypothetical protein
MHNQNTSGVLANRVGATFMVARTALSGGLQTFYLKKFLNDEQTISSFS